MTQHYNPSIVERSARILNSKAGDYISDEIDPNIKLVIPVEPRIDIVKSQSAAVTGSATIFTTPADKDFYLKTLQASIIKNATCDVATSNYNVQAFIDGVQTPLCRLSMLTLTAQDKETFIQFTGRGIRCDRGSTIVIGSNTYTAGLMNRSATITGYTEEVQKN